MNTKEETTHVNRDCLPCKIKVKHARVEDGMVERCETERPSSFPNAKEAVKKLITMCGKDFNTIALEAKNKHIKKMHKTNCPHSALKRSKDGLGGFYYTCEDCEATTRTRMKWDEKS